jgi:hypothetical protein
MNKHFYPGARGETGEARMQIGGLGLPLEIALVIGRSSSGRVPGRSFGDRRHNLEIQPPSCLVEPGLGPRFSGRNDLPIIPFGRRGNRGRYPVFYCWRAWKCSFLGGRSVWRQPPSQPRFQLRYKPLPSGGPSPPGVQARCRQHLCMVSFRQPCEPLLRPRASLRQVRQHRVFAQSAMRRRAAPDIVLRPAHNPRSQGISFHIADGHPQMFFIQRAGEKSPLP